MSAVAPLHENVKPPRPLTDAERRFNTDKGLLEMARQMDALVQEVRTLRNEVQHLQAVVQRMR